MDKIKFQLNELIIEAEALNIFLEKAEEDKDYSDKTFIKIELMESQFKENKEFFRYCVDRIIYDQIDRVSISDAKKMIELLNHLHNL